MSSSSIPELVSPIKGTADVATILRLIQDPAFQKDVKKYLADVEGARKILNETIEAYGKARELEGLLADVKTKERGVNILLKDTETKVKNIMIDAESKISSQQRDIDSQKEGLDNRRILMNRDETSHREDMKNREEAVTKELDEARELYSKATTKMEQAESLREKAEEVLERLRKAGVNI